MSRLNFAFSIGLPALSVLAPVPLAAQMHKVVAPPQNVVRAVGVYEWTGDMAKPAASRLIPISLFIDGKLQDAAIYLSRPVPMALLTGNVYELQTTGKPLGTLELAFARHFEASAAGVTPYDDGWFGYGKFVSPAAEKQSTLRASATLPKINGIDDDDDSRPHFSSRSATPGSGDSAAPLPGESASASTPADDPDRPKLKKSSSGSAADQASSVPPDPNDPDRPTLRRHPAADAHAADASPFDTALNDDPNRPTLHRGKPVRAMTDEDIPKLSGLPGDQDLHQLVAVSDAATRPMHDFSRAWDDDAERLAILGKMEAAARAQLVAYAASNPAAAAITPKPAPAAHPATRTHRAATPPAPAPAPPPVALLEEKLTGYTLSYGGAATFVYQAHTDGLGNALQFVTLVAQVNMQGEPEFALKNVTDASHLDRNPRMRLVDAVDAEASNRASLLFELRARNSRQFALYRVIGGRATQTFLTGSTQ